jgi:tetratricopeptide (TPR) repeat protein
MLMAMKEPVSLGRLYRHFGRFDEALDAVADALETDAENRAALLLGAEASADRGDTPEMARFTALLLARDPDDAEARALLAEATLRTGELDRAAREAASILGRHPESARALQVHAVAHAELGNRNLARESFEKLLLLEPDDWIQLGNLGRLELAAGNLERSAELFERAVDLNSRNLEGYRGLEESARRIGDEVRLERARTMIGFLTK